MSRMLGIPREYFEVIDKEHFKFGQIIYQVWTYRKALDRRMAFNQLVVVGSGKKHYAIRELSKEMQKKYL